VHLVGEDRAQLRALIVLSGVLLILFGLSKAVFKYQLAEPTEQWIGTGLFCCAAVLFLQMFKVRREERNRVARQGEERGGDPGQR
jgi:protein-S-isoprenylcysteine O-methyltransferase Ste14